jgi:propanol-preferring alcohol dehydrogenase
MKAMLLREITSLKQNPTPLSFADTPEPVPGEGEILLRVTRCGVCHTELDEIEGRTPPPHLPVVLGHQVVGIIESFQSQETLESTIKTGQRVGVAWIAAACGHCQHCLAGNENLCASSNNVRHGMPSI